MQVAAEVWIVSAEAGANGSLHTGWAWEMRMNPKITSEMQTLLLESSLTRGEGAADRAKTISPVETNVASAEQDTDIMARLDNLLAEHKLYLDPDLSLGQLSRKLRVPVKQLSGAINRSTGKNVSRYINRQRIKAACMALDAGENVTTTMYASGFNAKSNFNREFLRIIGVPPSVRVEQQDK